MAVYKRNIVDIDLEQGQIHRAFLNHSIGMYDQQADRFGIRVFRDGEPVNLAGVSVQGVFMPPQGSPIAITGSTYTSVSGNTAEVILPQACYNYEGNFTLAIKLVDSGNSVTGTMRIVDGMVDNTHASGTVAPTSAVPTYQEILAVYGEMVECVEDYEEVVEEQDQKIDDLGEMSPNLVDMPDAEYSSHGVEIKVNDGKVTVKNRKTDSGTAVAKISNVFNIPAGTYYFGSRKWVPGGLFLQLREYSGTSDLGSLAQTNGFVKVTISEDKGAAVRVAFHQNDTYDVNGVDIYPELIPVDVNEEYTPFGLRAVDDLARKDNEVTQYGFVSRYAQKRIAIIGDSISSFRDHRYCGDYVAYYPAFDVDTVEKTWWKRIANGSGSVIAFNESEAGAYATNQRPDGRIDFYARVNALAARNVNPDLIFVALGTNDSVNSVAIGDYDFETTYTSLSESTFRPAYIKGIKALQANFPNAKIVCMIFQMDNEYAYSISHIAYRLGCELIYCMDYETGSTVHPNDKGMRKIASTILLNAERNAMSIRTTFGATDLNDYKEPGIYGLMSGENYSHLPTGVPNNPSQAMHLIVYRNPDSTNYLIQRLYFTSGNTIAHYSEYIRVWNGGDTWRDWVNVYDLDDEKAFKGKSFIYMSIDGISDLNDFDRPGFTMLDSTVLYDHLPDGIGTGAKHIIVYRNPNADYLIQRLYITGGNSVSLYREFIRVRNSATNWNDWKEVYNKANLDKLLDAGNDNDVLYYTTDTFDGGQEYTGDPLRILSYNVAKYNNDTETYISDEKRFNIKKMLSETQPDLIGIQEEYRIDGDNKQSLNYIYAPAYPIEQGNGTLSLKSRISPTTNVGMMYYTNGRWLRAALYTINEKRILFCTTHPVANYESTGSDSAESIAARLVQYQEMFKWVFGEITLNDVTSGNAKTRPEWDYCIISGDMNTITETDRTNLKSLAAARNFTMASGGWMGWLETARNKAGTVLYSLDNVLVSENVVITGVRSCKSKYQDLYSDHYPFVVDVVLKDEET